MIQCCHCNGTGFCSCNDCMDEQFMSARTWRCRFCGGSGELPTETVQETVLEKQWKYEAGLLGMDDLID